VPRVKCFAGEVVKWFSIALITVFGLLIVCLVVSSLPAGNERLSIVTQVAGSAAMALQVPIPTLLLVMLDLALAFRGPRVTRFVALSGLALLGCGTVLWTIVSRSDWLLTSSLWGAAGLASTYVGLPLLALATGLYGLLSGRRRPAARIAGRASGS
jgi:hypothetical protein